MSQRPHAPKVAALMALEAGSLSAPGAERLQRHVRRCPLCQATRADMAAYAQVRSEVHALSVPELDWTRVTEAVAQATTGRDEPPQHRRQAEVRRAVASDGQRVAWASLALAACAALAYVGLGDPDTGERRSAPPAPSARAVAARETAPPAAPDRPQIGRVTAERGQIARLAAGDASGPDRPGPEGARAITTLREGDTLRVPAGGAVDFQLEGGARVRLADAGALTARRLRERLISLSLHGGTLTQLVPPLAPGATYEVRAGAYHVVVTGTHFAVTRRDARVRVDLVEGSVAVRGEDGETLASLRAPASWHSQDPHLAAAPHHADAPTLARPYALPDVTDMATVSLPALPNVTAWQVRDSDFGGASVLAMRAPLGDFQLTAQLTDGRAVPVSLTVVEGGLHLSAARLRRLVPALSPRQRAGKLSSEQLMQVITRARPRMQACYERTLRRDPELRPKLSLRARLAGDGRVRRVKVHGDGVPPSLSTCLERLMRAQRFPAPGGPLTFDIPLNFQARRR